MKTNDRLEKAMDYLEDNMDKIMSVSQCVLGAIMLLLVLATVIGNLVLGRINSFFGFVLAFAFVAIIYALFRVAYREMREELKK